MAVRYFTFSDRYIPVRFFPDDPVTVTMCIDDQTDKKVDSVVSALQAADTLEKKTGVLNDLIGAENTEKILERAEQVDAYTIDQITAFVVRTYVEEKRKNLNAAASGRMK